MFMALAAMKRPVCWQNTISKTRKNNGTCINTQYNGLQQAILQMFYNQEWKIFKNPFVKNL